ncbi:MAG: hypothetical protein Q7S42_03895, partial [Candidatus Omnitrophota bacterium]|nr:hypothetical protein [Candidatus Omnitrophota bacterium]
MERKIILNLIIVFLFAILLIGLLNLDILQGAKFRFLSDSNSIRLIPQSGARGNILDRNGQIIVDNRISYDVMILPQELDHIDYVLSRISRLLGIEVSQLKTAFKKNFISSSVPVTVISNIDLKKAILLGEYRGQEP